MTTERYSLQRLIEGYEAVEIFAFTDHDEAVDKLIAVEIENYLHDQGLHHYLLDRHTGEALVLELEITEDPEEVPHAA